MTSVKKQPKVYEYLSSTCQYEYRWQKKIGWINDLRGWPWTSTGENELEKESLEDTTEKSTQEIIGDRRRSDSLRAVWQSDWNDASDELEMPS